MAPFMGLLFSILSLVLFRLTWASSLPTGDAAVDSPAVEQVSSHDDLFDFEKLQLTDQALADCANQGLGDISPFSFRRPHPGHPKPRPRCKTYPGDPDWPTDKTWHLFDHLLGGVLIKTVPEAAVCYPEWGHYSASECAELTATWENSTYRIQDPTSINALLYENMTCLPPAYTPLYLRSNPTCFVGGYPTYSVNVSKVGQIQLAVNFARERNLRLVIKNTGHDFLAKSTGKGALSIWTHHLKWSRFYPEYESGTYRGPAFKLAAGIQVFEANQLAKEHNVTLIGGEGADVGLVGGYAQGGGHSPLTSLYGLAADHVLSLNLITSSGHFLTASPTTNSSLFWALRGGGGGTFGVVTSMTVKAFPQLTVSTMIFNLTTSSSFSANQLWAAHAAFVNNFIPFADRGYYSYYKIFHTVRNDPASRITLTLSLVAPKTALPQLLASVEPLFAEWTAIGVPLAPGNPLIREYDNYPDAWRDAFPLEAWDYNSRTASRFVPREVLANEQRRREVLEAVRWVFEQARGGVELVLFNMRGLGIEEEERVVDENGVSPRWRRVVMFAIMVGVWEARDGEGFVAELSRNLTGLWNRRWREVLPGAGTYLSEADYIEPGWQESFWGDKYGRLLRIKRDWDPEGVFWAPKAVGSEEWELSRLVLGHLPSQDSRLCRARRD